MKSTDRVRVITFDCRNDMRARYNKVPKGRKVMAKERPTYDQACRAMLTGLIESWHVYEDGWTFTVSGVETEAMTLAAAGEYLARIERPVELLVTVPVDDVAARFAAFAA
jgi:hypothetical protein